MAGPEISGDPRGVVLAEFTLSDLSYPFVSISETENCEVILQKMLPRGSGEWAEYFSIHGTDPDRVLELAETSELVRPRLIDRYDSGGLFEFVVGGFCPARDLSERGAIPQEVYSKSGDGKIIIEIPPQEDANEIIEGFLDNHDSAELVKKRTLDRLTPLFTQEDLEQAVAKEFTPRQHEVLRTAVQLKYYDPTTETTMEDIGEELGIQSPTVSQHLKEAERKLVSILFGEVSY